MTSMNAIGGLAIGMQLAQTQTALTAAAAIMVSELMGSYVLITMSAKRAIMIAMRKLRAPTLGVHTDVLVLKVTMEMAKAAKVRLSISDLTLGSCKEYDGILG